MKYNKEIYFSYIVEFDEYKAMSAVFAADQYKRYVLLSFESDVLEQYSDYIVNNSEYKKRVETHTVSSKILKGVITDFLHEILNEPQAIFVEVSLIDGQNSLINRDGAKKLIFDIFDKKNYDARTRAIAESLIEESGASVYLKNALKKINGVIKNINSEIESFYNGDSFLSYSENFNKQYSTDLESLGLLELKALVKKLEPYRNTEFTKINLEMIKRVNELKGYFNVIPSHVNHVNFLTQRNNYNHDAFPSVFKLISAIQFESSLRTLERKNSHLSFLHSIRALDTYIDGFLIYSGSAKLDDYSLSLKNGNILKLRDTFVLNTKIVKGISDKLEEVGNIRTLQNDRDYLNVKEIIKIRNKLNLTHGDLKVCKKISKESILRVKSLILKLEPVNQKDGFEWDKVRENIHNALSFNSKEIILDSIYEQFDISI